MGCRAYHVRKYWNNRIDCLAVLHRNFVKFFEEVKFLLSTRIILVDWRVRLIMSSIITLQVIFPPKAMTND